MKKLREKLSAFVLMSHFYRVRGSVFYSPFSSPFPSKESTNKNEYFLQFIMPKQHPCRFSAPGITGGKNRYFFFLSLFCSIFVGSVLIIPWECLIVANSLRWSIHSPFPPLALRELASSNNKAMWYIVRSILGKDRFVSCFWDLPTDC